MLNAVIRIFTLAGQNHVLCRSCCPEAAQIELESLFAVVMVDHLEDEISGSFIEAYVCINLLLAQLFSCPSIARVTVPIFSP